MASRRGIAGLRDLGFLAWLGMGAAVGVVGDAMAQMAAPAPQNVLFTAPDKSASVQLPPGWQVQRASGGTIVVFGPGREMLALGTIFAVADAAKVVNASNGLRLAYQTPLAQKLTYLLRHSMPAPGAPPPSAVRILQQAPQKAAPSFGECGEFIGTLAFPNNFPSYQFATTFCSLPPGASGYYKNLFIYASAPQATAQAEMPSLESLLRSYTVPSYVVQQALAPLNAAPQPPVRVATAPGNPAPGSPADVAEAAEIMRETNIESQAVLNQAQCFDATSLRGIPEWRVPQCH